MRVLLRSQRLVTREADQRGRVEEKAKVYIWMVHTQTK